MAQLYCVTLAAGVLAVLFDVAYQSYLPSVIGTAHLVEGNSKLTGTAQVAQVIGPSISGALVQAIGGALAVAVDAGSFLFSAGAVTTMHGSDPYPQRGIRLLLVVELHEGLKFVFGHSVLRVIAATTATANFFGAMLTAIEVPFLVCSVHASSGVIGLLFAAIGAGGLLGALASRRVATRVGGGQSVKLGILMNAAVLLVPLARSGIGLLWFAGGYFISSFGTVVYNVNQVSFRQRLCPEHLLGRMNATMRFVVWGVLPIGALLGGLMAANLGLRGTLWLAAIGSAAAGLWLVIWPVREMGQLPLADAD